VHVWAEARPRAAAVAAAPYAYAPDRDAVDRLPAPDPGDGCARPQAAGEALAVTLTGPAPPPCGGGTCTVFLDFFQELFQGSNLGGLTGADGICQQAADDAGLNRDGTATYKAWLSDDTASPSTRFTRAAQPYVLPNGTQVAADWADLTDSSLDNAIILGPDGQSALPAPQQAWTGTFADGTGAPANCGGWTTGADQGLIGTPADPGPAWSDSTAAPCTEFRPLYCFQQ
jgi:hypothetical protein